MRDGSSTTRPLPHDASSQVGRGVLGAGCGGGMVVVAWTATTVPP